MGWEGGSALGCFELRKFVLDMDGFFPTLGVHYGLNPRQHRRSLGYFFQDLAWMRGRVVGVFDEADESDTALGIYASLWDWDCGIGFLETACWKGEREGLEEKRIWWLGGWWWM
jgi:hypothetical protein